MPEFVQTLISNWEMILAVFGALHILALAIVNITPTPRDDEIYGKVYRVFEVIGGVVSKTAKEWPGERDAIKAVDAMADDMSLNKKGA
jgi:hypothetical protein